MGQQPVEPEGSPEVQPNGPDNNSGNPSWNEILDILPEEFHGLIKPKLESWDSVVQDKFQQIHQQYDPYKPLIENQIPLQTVEQALFLAQQLENNPAELVAKAIEHYNLEQYKQAAQTVTPSEPEDEFVDTDIDVDALMNDPRLKPFFDKQKEFEQYLEQQKSEREEAEASDALETYLTELHNEHGDFDDMYVTTLLANGVDGKAAVDQFKQTINTYVEKLNPVVQETPPVVAGASGTTGSGVPDQPVKFGAMKNSDVNAMVAQYIQNAQQSG